MPARQRRPRGSQQPAGPRQGDEDVRSAPAGRLDLQSLLLAAATALVVCTPLIPSEAAPEQGIGIVIVMLWLIALAGWFLSGLSSRSLPMRIGPASFALLVFLLAYVVSGLVRLDDGNARATINSLWQWVALGVSFFLLRQLITTQAAARALLVVMVGLASGLACFGFYQHFVEFPRNVRQYEQDPQAVLQEYGFTAMATAPELRHFDDRIRSTEPFATFALANSFAGFLVPWLVVVLGLAMTAGNRKESASARRHVIATLFIAALLGGCLLLTKSRSAYVATGAGVLLLLVWQWRRSTAASRKWLLWTAIFSALAACAVLSAVWFIDPLILAEAPKSLLYRMQYWRAALAMAADYPWFGSGPGNFQQYYTSYKRPEASETVADPHNFLLEIWSTGGTVVFLAWIGLLAFIAVQAGRANRRATPASAHDAGRHREVAGAGLGAVVSIYCGAAVGVLMSYPVGFLVGYPPHLAVLVLALPVAALVCWSLSGWALRGELDAWLPALAAVVLLLNLLAAGGISFPGVAQCGWLLAAVALNAAVQYRGERRVGRTGILLGIIMSLGLVLVLHQTAFRPVMVAQTRLAQAELSVARGDIEQALRHLGAAAAADPFWYQPWWQRAQLAHSRWMQTRDPQDWQRFELSVEQALARNPRASELHRLVGNLYLNAYRLDGKEEQIDAALAAYRRASRLHPNHNMLHAQLAWTYHLKGDSERAAQQAAEALRLDELNPHSEQKLSMQRLPEADEVLPSQPMLPDIDAEQLMRRLRSS